MQRIKLLTLALLGVLALSALAFTATSSAALPEMLPEGTAKEPIHFKIEQDNVGTLETLGGTQVSCAKLSGEGLIEKLKLGKLSLVFKECKETLFGTPCSGLIKEKEDEPSGQITAKGEFHSWYGLLEKKLVNAVVVLPEHTHFLCDNGLILVLVLGCVAGELLGKLAELLKSIDVHFLRAKGTKGDPDIPEVLNEEGKFIKCELKTAINEGTEESSSIEQLALLKGFVKLVGGVPKEITALLMY